MAGEVVAIAHRPVDSDPMVEAVECEIAPGRGIVSENRKPGTREITLISAEAWEEVCRELGTRLPWYSRRANILVRGIDLSSTIGRRLGLGGVKLLIHGETKPCGIMDQQAAGLTKALVPDCRGGV